MCIIRLKFEKKKQYLLLVLTTDIMYLLLSCVFSKKGVKKRGGRGDRFFERGGELQKGGGDGLQREGLKVVTNCGKIRAET